jgi:hypothetical protein
MNLSLDAVGGPITMVPSVLEKDIFLGRMHYICSEDVLRLRNSFCQYSVFVSRSVQPMRFSTDSESLQQSDYHLLRTELRICVISVLSPLFI